MEAQHQGFDIVQKLLGITMLGTEWVLWLLIALSIVSLAVVIERIIFFNKMKFDMTDFSEKLTQSLVAKDWDSMKRLCESTPALAAQTILRGIEAKDRGAHAMEESMTGYMIGHRQKLDQGLMILGTLGNNAPFIGLFGTVLGIIIAFRDLALNPQGGASVVMRGISEALIATAVGLIVAIPAVIAYNYFQRIVKRHGSNAESLSKLLMSHKAQ
ncbi:MAG: MotA/TolQ/ExbB proton channel family protein [Proteobacteria bacterium]|nr:MotA/TolQ/ExbB proton channel family protein [Pseudomonadota bacterium]